MHIYEWEQRDREIQREIEILIVCVTTYDIIKLYAFLVKGSFHGLENIPPHTRPQTHTYMIAYNDFSTSLHVELICENASVPHPLCACNKDGR